VSIKLINKKFKISKKSAYIISLKFTPGLAKEFFLIGEKLKEHGWDTRYILSKGYKWLMEEDSENIIYLASSRSLKEMFKDSIGYLRIKRRIIDIFRKQPPDFVCLYNPHPLSKLVLSICKKTQPKGIRSIYLHEPYKPDKRSFGLAGRLYYYLAEFFQSISLKDATDIIFPSASAKEVYLLRYKDPSTVKLHTAPLLLRKYKDKRRKYIQRKYISFIGTINKSRGLSEFLSLVQYVYNLNRYDIRFKIVTRNPINRALRKLSTNELSLLDVVNRTNITDEEIADTVLGSLAIFLSHKQVTQSGSVPVAFKYGTPIIARNLPGFSQHIGHKVEGYLLPYDFSVKEFYDAVIYIKNHFENISLSCEEKFYKLFCEDNWDKYYDWLINKDYAASAKMTK